ncbi:MAG: ABC transporter permease [Actinobacteria bacterium]|nr:ABC transporter permease [Actinomycetota bacterium]MCL6104658.1 ABC transporter permease [Actinomycetota bacterium]
MSWIETFKVGLQSIAERRARSILTVLGLLIGISAVILSVGIGEGAQVRVNQAISSLGENLLIITPGSTNTGGVKGGLGSSSNLTMTDAQALGSDQVAPSIAAVAPIIQKSFVLTAGPNNWTAPVDGTTPAFLTVRDRTVAIGKPFTQADLNSNAQVALIGSEVAASLFPGVNPVGKSVNISGLPFVVIGVLNQAGATANGNQDNIVVVPITTAESELVREIGPYVNSLSMIVVSAKSTSAMSAAYQEANNLLLQLHHITVPSQADFTITPQTALLATAQSISKTLTILLGAIAAISLLVGGIGVMNIMLVSVTERIKEIGLRKALGATPGLILRQFLIEAVVLGLTGGVLGSVLGVGGALILPHLLSTTVVVSPPAIVGAVVIAAGIGLIFGVYPASKAAKLSPIDALRSE